MGRAGDEDVSRHQRGPLPTEEKTDTDWREIARPTNFAGMAWRIDEPLIRGEIDNRTRGMVRGTLWFAGRDEPVVLELQGDAWRDLAGHVLRITNPAPKAAEAGALDGFASRQTGAVGDITASRKVKVPECTMDELMEFYKAKKPFPWHWGNSLYLEWHSEQNGRVVIESASYQLEIVGEAAWTMSEEEETRQRQFNGQAMNQFMVRLEDALDLDADDALPDDEDEEDADAPTTKAEAAADAEQARMDLLLDRVNARMLREMEAGGEPDLERIMDEERARLRRELGEPEPEPLTPEEEARQAAWVEEMNAVADEALNDLEADSWDTEDAEDRTHPLVERCTGLWSRLMSETEERGWLTDAEPEEHPLREVVNGVMIAGPKLAGALNGSRGEDWPPPALFAGHTLVRLKKARGHLHDAMAGLTAATEQGLASPAWLAVVRAEVVKLVAEVDTLIDEVRAVLKNAEEEDGG